MERKRKREGERVMVRALTRTSRSSRLASRGRALSAMALLTGAAETRREEKRNERVRQREREKDEEERKRLFSRVSSGAEV